MKQERPVRKKSPFSLLPLILAVATCGAFAPLFAEKSVEIDVTKEADWRITHSPEMAAPRLQYEVNVEGLTFRFEPLPPPSPNYIDAAILLDWKVPASGTLEVDVRGKKALGHHLAFHLKTGEGIVYHALATRDPASTGFLFPTEGTTVKIPLSDFKTKEGETLQEGTYIESFSIILAPAWPNTVTVSRVVLIPGKASE